MANIYTIERLETFRRISRWESAEAAKEYAESHAMIVTASGYDPAIRYAETLPQMAGKGYAEVNIPLFV